MGGTIAYTVDSKKSQATSAYELQVLTVATGLRGVNTDLEAHQLCKVGEHSGAAGHVMLTFPTGGQLLTSCGHWIELSKLDVSQADLFKAAEAQYGTQYVENMQQEMNACASVAERSEYVSKQSVQMIQQSAPCKYSSY
eukprot:TRINITY_DN5023_c0_g2_i9.p2 TRINITY_DN5023_c0_g2~~TRINITY_DN5023_c0_g2_i9.p2  ORF type:complete len:139 (+),score=35.55 TRINITY_DN5023_c0_g2_i9:253-669(+)